MIVLLYLNLLTSISLEFLVRIVNFNLSPLDGRLESVFSNETNFENTLECILVDLAFSETFFNLLFNVTELVIQLKPGIQILFNLYNFRSLYI